MTNNRSSQPFFESGNSKLGNDQPEKHHSGIVHKQTKNNSIFVVDDEPRIRQASHRMLSRQFNPQKIWTFGGFEDLYKIIQTRQHHDQIVPCRDLILADNNIPNGMSGLQFAEATKDIRRATPQEIANGIIDRIRIIMLSGDFLHSGNIKTIEQCIKDQVIDAYLSKPAAPDHIMEQIHRQLALSAAGIENEQS